MEQLHEQAMKLKTSDEDLQDALQRLKIWWQSYAAGRQDISQLALSKSSPASAESRNVLQELQKDLDTLGSSPTPTTGSAHEETVARIQHLITKMMRIGPMLVDDSEADLHILADRDRYSRLPMEADIQFVKEKYPSCEAEWLLTRLGAAITKRRQYLLYLETTNQPIKLIGTNWLYSKSRRDSTDSYDSTMETTYGYREKDSRIPTLAVSSGFGGRVQCPCCLNVQTFRSEKAWRKHFLIDLRPYICTFRNCGLMAFVDWDSWYAHEMETHRRQWVCPCCDIPPFYTSSAFVQHLDVDEAHRNYISDERMRELAVTTSGAREEISLCECPLCKPPAEHPNADSSAREFMEHLSDHLEELAVDAYDRYWKSIYQSSKLVPSKSVPPSLTHSANTVSTRTAPSFADKQDLRDIDISIRARRNESTSDSGARSETYSQLALERSPSRSRSFGKVRQSVTKGFPFPLTQSRPPEPQEDVQYYDSDVDTDKAL